MLISEALKRGEIHKLLPQTPSPGVDYSLHHGDGGDVVGGDGDHADSAQSEFSPFDLQFQVSVSWFLCLRPPPRETPRGNIFIVSFRSR